MNTNDIVTGVYNSFESMKNKNENGTDYWNAHDIAKVLGYSQFNKMMPAIERARDSIANRGIDPDLHIQKAKESYTNGIGRTVPVDGYRMTRIGSYYTVMNADPRKEAVSSAQAYFVDSTVTLDKMKDNMDDLGYITARNNLRITNKAMRNTLLRHDVPDHKLGVVLDNGYLGLFNQTARELKEGLNLPKNTEVSDVLGAELACIKGTASALAKAKIENNNIRGIKDTGEVIYNEHRKMRDMVEEAYNKAPEEMLPGRNVKNIEKKYKKNINTMLKGDVLN